VNKTACDIVGCEPGETLGERWHRFLHPDDREAIVANWRPLTEQGRNLHSEIRVLHRERGEKDKAIARYRMAIQKAPNNPQAKQRLQELGVPPG